MLSYIPSPSRGVFHLGPLPLRIYAVCIILGVIVAAYLGDKRAVARGLPKGVVPDVATICVPFGLVGARVYHVITSPAAYFGKGGHPIEALYVWRGGLGIWGAVLAGAISAYYVCKRRGIPFLRFADAVGPCVVVAQAIGRFGNYFNQELYGRASTLPWALKIDCAHVVEADVAKCSPAVGYLTFQPTFLYESLWDLGVFALCIWADKRFKMHAGRVMALYVAAYTVGRGWIEYLRVDDANHFLGLRLNDWTSIVTFVGAVSYLYSKRNAPPDPEYVSVESSTSSEPSVADITAQAGGPES